MLCDINTILFKPFYAMLLLNSYILCHIIHFCHSVAQSEKLMKLVNAENS
jgi:hypothetical protein